MLKIILNIFYNPVNELKEIILNNKTIYTPVNGGAKLKSDSWCRENLYFDDECENSISHLNSKLNELTSMWFFKQKLTDFGNPDYVGFNHYRRFFDLKRFENIDKDIFVAKPIKCDLSIMWQYGYYHNHQDLLKCIDVLSGLDVNFADGFYDYIRRHTDNFAPCNMFVMKRNLFIEWLDFIMHVMMRLIPEIDLSGRDNYQKRALCFLCERIFGYWAWRKCQAIPYEELDIVECLDFKNNNLNERGTYE